MHLALHWPCVTDFSLLTRPDAIPVANCVKTLKILIIVWILNVVKHSRNIQAYKSSHRNLLYSCYSYKLCDRRNIFCHFPCVGCEL